MFCSLKYLVAVAALWGILLGVLALTYSQEQAEICLLNDREMRLVAKGSVPTCTTNSLYSGTCNDFYATCSQLSGQDNCLGACRGCSGNTNGNTSICNMTDKPWSSLCNPGTPIPGGCGVFYNSPTCQWNGLNCYCYSDSIAVDSPCAQPQQQVYGACQQVQ